MIKTLQKKFLAAAIVAVFLVLSLLIGAMNLLNYHGLVVQADETLRLLSANEGAFPRQMLREQDRPAEPEPAAEPAALPPPEEPGSFLALRRGGGRELAYQSRYFAVWYAADGAVSRLDMDQLASLTEDEALSLAKSVYAAGKERGFAGEYRFCRTESEGKTLLLLLNCARELTTWRSFLYASAGISLAGMLAVFLLLLLFSGRIVRPIAESYEKQKRFITDAGHELKTPIAIIRADAEVLQSELAEENEWITDIRRQTHRLSELTAELIYLSRMEEEDAALNMQPFSLSELVEETAQSFQSLARLQDKPFSFSVAPDLSVKGDEKAAAKLVSILLDNAMKYSPAGGAVALSLDKSGKSACLRVKNSAPPMEKGDASRLFERFARGDRSRSSSSGGFGLGLSIAKAITQAHGGRIHALSEDGHSLTVTVELPLFLE